MARVIAWILAVLAALFLSLGFLAGDAWSHDFWINKSKYKGADGVHCCGEKDCPAIKPEDVTTTPHGYVLKTYDNELVPFSEAAPAEPDADGEIRFYRCHNAHGARRCFFAPIGGS